jgi:tetratricopeptide (TPR) repeat protein
MRASRLGLLARVCWAAAILAIAGPVWAQQDYSLGGGERSAAEMLADQLQMRARGVLAGQRQPREDQYQRARVLLEQALELEGDDPGRWRLRAELAKRMGEPDARVAALRRYTDLEPRDDRAFFQLLLARVEQLQTVDARLERVERILDSDLAEQLTDPVRSRLASYAAEAVRELGGADERMMSHLQSALEWDPSNQQAGRLMYELLQAREVSAVRQAAAAVHLARAAPLDGSVRRRLAEHLAEQAVYEQAVDQFENARRLSPQSLSEASHRQWAISLAALGQTQGALDLLSGLGKALGSETSDASESEGEGDGSGEASGDKSVSALPLDLELVRLAILQQPEQAERVETVFDRIWQRLAGPAEAGRQDAQLELAWMAAVFDRRREQVQPWLEAAPENERRRRLATGWLAIHDDEPDRARELLEPIADADPMAAYGLARLSNGGQASEARALRQVVRQAPTALGGLMAARRLNVLGEPTAPTRAGASVVELMQSMPHRLWRLERVENWVDVSWRFDSGRFGYLEPIAPRLMVRNRTRLPLTIGAGQTLPPQALLLTAPFQGGQSLGTLSPMVVDIGRGLVLEPNESLGVTVRLDRSDLGGLLANNPFSSFNFNVTAHVNPRRSTGGGIQTGLIGDSETQRALIARGLPATGQNVRSWLAVVDSDDPVEQLTGLARLVRLTPEMAGQQQGQNEEPAQPGQGGEAEAGAVNPLNENAASQPEAPAKQSQAGPLTMELVQKAADRVNALYSELGPARRAWCVLMIRQNETATERFSQILNQARQSEAPLVRLAYLAQHVAEPDAPALTEALRGSDGPVRRFAVGLQAALQRQAEAEAGPEGSANEQTTPGESAGPMQK